MNVATIIVSLLSIVCGKYQEMQLIRELTDYFNFDHHFYLLDSSAETSRFINQTGITPQSLHVLRSADNEVNGLENVKSINSKNTFMIVVPEDSQLDRNLLRWMKRIQRLQINMKIGVFFRQPTSIEDLHVFFEWCKDNLIINIFAATHPSYEVALTCLNCSINIFTFHPFGPYGVLNVTGSETYDGFFPSLKSNFNQENLHLGEINVNYDPWPIMLRLMNATLATDSGINFIAKIIPVETVTDLQVYPVYWYNYFILVPEAFPYEDFSSYLRTALSDEFCGYSFFSITAVILVLSFLRYTKQKKKLIFFQSTADVLNLLMNDNGYIKYPQLSRSEVLLIVPLTFIGFIVANGILSNLKSFLTRPVLQPQINTLEEIYRSPFRIIVGGGTAHLIKHFSNRTEGKDWSNKFFSDRFNFLPYMLSYNRTLIYPTETNYANLLLRLQKRLKIKGYHNPHIHIFSELKSYRLNEKFLFFERFNEIILRLKSAGFYEFWTNFEKIEKIVVLRWLQETTDSKTHVAKFEFPMFVFYGWLTGLILLILEIIWSKNEKKILSFCKVLGKNHLIELQKVVREKKELQAKKKRVAKSCTR